MFSIKSFLSKWLLCMISLKPCVHKRKKVHKMGKVTLRKHIFIAWIYYFQQTSNEHHRKTKNLHDAAVWEGDYLFWGEVVYLRFLSSLMVYCNLWCFFMADMAFGRKFLRFGVWNIQRCNDFWRFGFENYVTVLNFKRSSFQRFLDLKLQNLKSYTFQMYATFLKAFQDSQAFPTFSSEISQALDFPIHPPRSCC